MSKTIHDLRDRLFDALDALADKEAPMEIARAQAIAEVAQVVINSAKVEIEHQRLTQGNGSGFLSAQTQPPALPGNGHEPAKPTLQDLPRRTHRLQG